MKKIFIILLVLIVIFLLTCNLSVQQDIEKVEKYDNNFLTFVQESTFKYFYDYAHEETGLIPERYGAKYVTIGGTGMGLMALIVGAHRNFVTREQAADRVLKILRWLDNSSDRHHGAWPHWMNYDHDNLLLTTRAFDPTDDGGDLVETGFLMQGILTVHQYFDRDNTAENEIQLIADKLWSTPGKCVEWDWYAVLGNGSDPTEDTLYWHWSTLGGFAKKMPVNGFNEAMIVFLLAMAAPNNFIDVSWYRKVWAGYHGGTTSDYLYSGERYGYKQYVQMQGYPYLGIGEPPHYTEPWGDDISLFWTHYSFLGFDPRGKNDGIIPEGVTYFDVCKNISLINWEYCKENTEDHEGYSSLVWGLTASDNPSGYLAHAPVTYRDNGTITPTAAIGAMPYLPSQSIATMKHIYLEYGEVLWGPCGFRDAFNLSENPDWYAGGYIAIDQGPIIIMIENYRSQLLWKYFMSHPDIQSLLTTLKDNSWDIEDISY